MKRYDLAAWKKTRLNHLKTYPECRVCDLVNKSNHVHHLRYRGPRGKSERPGDLVTLCAYHHKDLHKLWKGGSAGPNQTLGYIADERALIQPGEEPDVSWIV